MEAVADLSPSRLGVFFESSILSSFERAIHRFDDDDPTAVPSSSSFLRPLPARNNIAASFDTAFASSVSIVHADGNVVTLSNGWRLRHHQDVVTCYSGPPVTSMNGSPGFNITHPAMIGERFTVCKKMNGPLFLLASSKGEFCALAALDAVLPHTLRVGRLLARSLPTPSQPFVDSATTTTTSPLPHPTHFLTLLSSLLAVSWSNASTRLLEMVMKNRQSSSSSAIHHQNSDADNTMTAASNSHENGGFVISVALMEKVFPFCELFDSSIISEAFFQSSNRNASILFQQQDGSLCVQEGSIAVVERLWLDSLLDGPSEARLFYSGLFFYEAVGRFYRTMTQRHDELSSSSASALVQTLIDAMAAICDEKHFLPNGTPLSADHLRCLAVAEREGLFAGFEVGASHAVYWAWEAALMVLSLKTDGNTDESYRRYQRTGGLASGDHFLQRYRLRELLKALRYLHRLGAFSTTTAVDSPVGGEGAAAAASMPSPSSGPLPPTQGVINSTTVRISRASGRRTEMLQEKASQQQPADEHLRLAIVFATEKAFTFAKDPSIANVIASLSRDAQHFDTFRSFASAVDSRVPQTPDGFEIRKMLLRVAKEQLQSGLRALNPAQLLRAAGGTKRSRDS